MTQELLEQLKIVAEFDEWTHRPTLKGKGKGLWYKLSGGRAAWDLSAMKYHTSWDWQIPVWAKLNKEHYDILITSDFDKYAFDVRMNRPEKAFEVLVSIIKKLK